MNIKQQLKIKDMAAINPNGIARKRANINNGQKNTTVEELTYEYAAKIYPILKSVEKQYGKSIINIFDTIDLLIENDFYNDFVRFEEDESTKDVNCSFGVTDDKKRVYFWGDNLEFEFYLPNEYYDDINAFSAVFNIGSFNDYDILIQESDIQMMLEDTVRKYVNGKAVYSDTDTNRVKPQFDGYLNDIQKFQSCITDYVNDFNNWVNTEFPEVDE